MCGRGNGAGRNLGAWRISTATVCGSRKHGASSRCAECDWIWHLRADWMDEYESWERDCGSLGVEAMRFVDLWRWDGRVGRRKFAAVGLVGVAIKYNLDRLIAALV